MSDHSDDPNKVFFSQKEILEIRGKQSEDAFGKIVEMREQASQSTKNMLKIADFAPK